MSVILLLAGQVLVLVDVVGQVAPVVRLLALDHRHAGLHLLGLDLDCHWLGLLLLLDCAQVLYVPLHLRQLLVAHQLFQLVEDVLQAVLPGHVLGSLYQP